MGPQVKQAGGQLPKGADFRKFRNGRVGQRLGGGNNEIGGIFASLTNSFRPIVALFCLGAWKWGVTNQAVVNQSDPTTSCRSGWRNIPAIDGGHGGAHYRGSVSVEKQAGGGLLRDPHQDGKLYGLPPVGAERPSGVHLGATGPPP